MLLNVPPIYQLIFKYLQAKRHRKEAEISRNNYVHVTQPRLSKKILKETLRNRTLEAWQGQWDRSTKGRQRVESLGALMPNLTQR